MSKKIKALELDTLRRSFAGVKDYILVEPIAVDSSTDYEFRKKLRAKNIKAQIVKNTYARKIFGEMGMTVDAWSGPTLLCWGGANVKDLSTNVETAVKESKKDPKSPEKYKVKTAVADGQSISLEIAKTLPTREEAIGEILAALMGPGASLAAALMGPATEVAGILKTIEEKKPEETKLGEAKPEGA